MYNFDCKKKCGISFNPNNIIFNECKDVCKEDENCNDDNM
jgi:hypothetical protein